MVTAGTLRRGDRGRSPLLSSILVKNKFRLALLAPRPIQAGLDGTIADQPIKQAPAFQAENDFPLFKRGPACYK